MNSENGVPIGLAAGLGSVACVLSAGTVLVAWYGTRRRAARPVNGEAANASVPHHDEGGDNLSSASEMTRARSLRMMSTDL